MCFAELLEDITDSISPFGSNHFMLLFGFGRIDLNLKKVTSPEVAMLEKNVETDKRDDTSSVCFISACC